MEITDFKFALDKLQAINYSFPEYVSFVKQAALRQELPPNYEPTNIDLTSQENIWLSAVKVACMPQGIERTEFGKKVQETAARFGILEDVENAVQTLQKEAELKPGIRTNSDWETARNFLHKNAEQLDNDVKQKLVDHLFEKAAELKIELGLTEKYDLYKYAGIDPTEKEEFQQYAVSHLHKLANGTFYTTPQFASIPTLELEKYLPRLVKQASFNSLSVFPPEVLAEAATHAPKVEADVLELLMKKHGEYPVRVERNLPVEINDDALLKL